MPYFYIAETQHGEPAIIPSMGRVGLLSAIVGLALLGEVQARSCENTPQAPRHYVPIPARLPSQRHDSYYSAPAYPPRRPLPSYSSYATNAYNHYTSSPGPMSPPLAMPIPVHPPARPPTLTPPPHSPSPLRRHLTPPSPSPSPPHRRHPTPPSHPQSPATQATEAILAAFTASSNKSPDFKTKLPAKLLQHGLESSEAAPAVAQLTKLLLSPSSTTRRPTSVHTPGGCTSSSPSPPSCSRQRPSPPSSRSSRRGVGPTTPGYHSSGVCWTSICCRTRRSRSCWGRREQDRGGTGTILREGSEVGDALSRFGCCTLIYGEVLVVGRKLRIVGGFQGAACCCMLDT